MFKKHGAFGQKAAHEMSLRNFSSWLATEDTLHTSSKNLAPYMILFIYLYVY